jgi:putative redox protein
MSEHTHRDVELTRVRKARFVARNWRGGELELGEGDDDAFTPVELLLTAIAGCMAIDVDYITSKRAEAERFLVSIGAEKIRDEHGNRLTDIVLDLDVGFPMSDAGTAAEEVLPRAVERSREKICTVGRTVAVGTPIATRVVGVDDAAALPSQATAEEHQERP